VGGSAIAVGLGALGWCYHLGNKVAAIEQQLADGGNTKIVAQLKNPASPQQLQANLATLSAQIQTAQVEGVKPNDKKAVALSQALSQVVKSSPDLPEAWHAAVQLVDYRYQPQNESSTDLPNCLDSVGDNQFSRGSYLRLNHADGTTNIVPVNRPIKGAETVAVVHASHCTLDLDDDGGFFSTTAGQDFKESMAMEPNTKEFILAVSDAHIKYSGGKVIPVNELWCQRCSFDIRPAPELPNKTIQTVTTRLLASTNTEDQIKIPFEKVG
jgi:hypothetical protein